MCLTPRTFVTWIFSNCCWRHQRSATIGSTEAKPQTPSPASPKMSEMKLSLCEAIDKESSALRELNLDIWSHPEICFQENHAHQVLTDFLESRGFQVERSYKLATAFRATIASSSVEPNTPTIGVMCEYDALPGIGHACGHNLIATAGVAAALGVKTALDSGKIKGKLVVLGCPAEEGGGGKIELIQFGAYQDIDVAMMVHPAQFNLAKPLYVALSRIRITYHGKESHASACPWEGRNALDAAVLCYQNISVLRQQMKPTWRVHGIIKNGGIEPNIIPAKTELYYYARAPTQKDLNQLQTKLSRCIEAAADATGCEVTYEYLPKGYAALMSNETLAKLYVTNGQILGIQFELDRYDPLKQGGSTDMGNVSRIIPSIHPKISLDTDVPLHSKDFTQIAKTDTSHRLTLEHSKVMAMAAIDVFSDPDLVKKIKEEFNVQLAADQ